MVPTILILQLMGKRHPCRSDGKRKRRVVAENDFQSHLLEKMHFVTPVAAHRGSVQSLAQVIIARSLFYGGARRQVTPRETDRSRVSMANFLMGKLLIPPKHRSTSTEWFCLSFFGVATHRTTLTNTNGRLVGLQRSARVERETRWVVRTKWSQIIYY